MIGKYLLPIAAFAIGFSTTVISGICEASGIRFNMGTNVVTAGQYEAQVNCIYPRKEVFQETGMIFSCQGTWNTEPREEVRMGFTSWNGWTRQGTSLVVQNGPSVMSIMPPSFMGSHPILMECDFRVRPPEYGGRASPKL